MAKRSTTDQGFRVERTFHPTGNIESEVTYNGEHIEGVTRKWHENGILASEVPVTASQCHGVMRQWNRGGELLGECEFIHGTGLHRTWFNNGHLESELYMRDGIPHGRLRGWDEEGELLIEQYFVSGRKVSKRKYLAACAQDASLPKYDEDGLVATLTTASLAGPTVESPSHSLGDHADAEDALQWLSRSTDESPRNLGECPPGDASSELVQEFLDEGAANVFVINVESDDDGSLNSGQLLIRLPRTPAQRKRALEFVNEHHVNMGYQPEPDVGQEFVLVVLE